MRLYQPEGQLVLLYYVVKRTAPSENTLQESSQEKRLGKNYQSSHLQRPMGGQLDWARGSVKCRLQTDCGLLFLGLKNKGTIVVTYSFA